MREALAARGLWPEDFIHDETREVRAAAIRNHPEMIRYAQRNKTEWYAVLTAVEGNPNTTLADLDFLYQLGSYGQLTEVDIEAHKIMRANLMVAKSLEPEHDVKHYEWAKGMSIDEIREALETREQAQQTAHSLQFSRPGRFGRR